MTKELIERCGRSYDRVAGLTKAQDSEWLSLDLGMGQLKCEIEGVLQGG